MLTAAILGDWKESKEAFMELKEEDPAIIARVLLYVYSRNYPNTLAVAPQSQLAGIEDSYSALSSNKTRLEQSANLHVEMFAVATRLGIEGLCDLARGRFVTIMGEWVHDGPIAVVFCFFSLSGILDIIKKVYTTTPENTRQLRDVIAFYASSDQHICSCSNDRYRGVTAFKEVPELLLDIFTGVFQHHEDELAWSCRRCDSVRDVWLPSCACGKRGRVCEKVECQKFYEDRLFCWACGGKGCMASPSNDMEAIEN